MKRLLLVFFTVLTGLNAFSQEETRELRPHNVIRYNFFGVFNKSFTGEFERVLSKKISVQLAVGYRDSNLDWQFALTDSLIDTRLFDLKQTGYTVVPQLKFYWTHFSKKMLNPTGAYFAPFLRFGYYNVQFSDYYYYNYDFSFDLLEIGGGTVMGFQLLAGRVFAIDVFMGPQLKFSQISNERYQNPLPKNPNAPQEEDLKSTFNAGIRFGVSIGFGFN